MGEIASRLDRTLLADALVAVLGSGVQDTLRQGDPVVAGLVRTLLSNPATARKLVDAVTELTVERRSEATIPEAFGPVATDDGAYDDAQLLFDPMGSPGFESAVDLLSWADQAPAEAELAAPRFTG